MEDYRKTNYCTQVQIFRDEKAIKSLIFNQDKIIIGRILSVDLIIDDISISRIHAAIDISDKGELSVSDLGSINGVVVDGKKVAESKIVSGQRVKLGDIEILVDLFKEDEIEVSPQPRVPIVEYYSELDDVVDLKKIASSRTAIVNPKNGKSYSVRTGVSGFFPLPQEREKGNVIESVLLLKDSIIDVKHIKDPKKLYIGGHKENDFTFGADELPGRLKVLSYKHGQFYVSIVDKMRGYIQKGSKKVSFEEIKADSSTIHNNDIYSFPIEMKDIIRIEVGNISFYFLFVGESSPLAKKQIIEPDPSYHTSLFLSFVLHLLLIMIFKTAQIPEYIKLEGIEDRFVNLIIDQKKPIYQEKFKKAQEKALEKPKPIEIKETKPIPKPPVKAEKIDVEKKRKTEKKPAPPAKQIVNIDPPKQPEKIVPLEKVTSDKIVSKDGTGTGDGLKRKAPKDVKSVGILGALNSGGKAGSLSNIFGKRGIGTGTNANVLGPRGVRGGAQSFGVKNISEGVGKTFGIGSGNVLGGAGEGTPGVVAATGALRGQGGVSLKAFNSLKGSKFTGTTNMSESNTVVVGSLTKEQIWSVVEKHFSEIQNCYEVALQGDKSLSGKVVLNWVIDANGRVKSVNTKETTLRNVYAESCMRNRIRYWLFPKPRGGGIVRVVFPFVFKPL